MATPAKQAEFPVMYIVLSVTTVTGLCHFAPFQGLSVAGPALQTLMGAIKHEFGPRVMVKVPILPVAGIVAKVTVRAKAQLMHVVFFMAAVTIQGSILKSLCLMAFLAFHLTMFS